MVYLEADAPRLVIESIDPNLVLLRLSVERVAIFHRSMPHPINLSQLYGHKIYSCPWTPERRWATAL